MLLRLGNNSLLTYYEPEAETLERVPRPQWQYCFGSIVPSERQIGVILKTCESARPSLEANAI